MESIQVSKVTKPSFTVIGIAGEGLAAESRTWIPPLWQEANSRFGTFAHLARKNEEGRLLALWGAMSDTGLTFERWSDVGMYMAGCEAEDDAEAPEGLTKWEVPGYEYLTAPYTAEQYNEVFHYVLAVYMPQHGYQLAGAIHECYPDPQGAGGTVLFFPFRRL